MSPEAQAFTVADLFPDRQAVRSAIEMILPLARNAAEKTETLVDDAAVDMWQALHDSDLAVQWAADEITRQEQIPEGALAVSVMPDAVKQDLVRHLPTPERREAFLNGPLLERALSWGLPLLLQILGRVFTK
ncbi:hypothetical protein KOR34_36980 [Posidoniimonas corsicana]|uniref:Uncharacterized protein n=1 Tax=Posidoniimonas corsicana TaxID=1938618 RepID=A0A5C5V7C0_9BACT|nr:hypothetical protein [Posidoniimonas corsicana]TWT33863.1 hypothetical protein KOR34_36980 [Posidoniimonas corsicana]